MTTASGAAGAGGRRTLARLPLFRSLEGSEPGALRGDVSAGLTVGVMLVPQGMAYALIAGMPPVYGLYAALVPLAVYALLGTSRQLAVGPVAMVSLLVATGVAPLAAGDPARYVTLALFLSGLVGFVQVAMGALRAGFLVNLLSHPVLAGFTAAAAIIIATSQLPGLVGLSVGRGAHTTDTVVAVAAAIADVNPITVGISAAAIAAGFLHQRVAPRVPAAMLLVAVGTLVSWALGLGARGVEIVGRVPSGLPTPTLALPSPADVVALAPIALTIALVGFMESIAVAKVYATRNRYDVDANQELIALGAANLAGSLFQSFPVTGGFSRTAVNGQAGARSQRSSLVSVAVIAITLLFLTQLFHHLPKAILGAIIVVAVAGLIDVRAARELWRVDRRDLALMVATFAATLALGIEEGIVVGIALSVGVVLEQISRPHIARLGRIPGTRAYRNVARHPEAVVEPGVEILRVDASLFYGNAEAVREAARAALARARSAGGSPVVVLDAGPMNRMDSTGLHTLREIVEEVRGASGHFLIAAAKGPLRDKLRAGGLMELLGPGALHDETQAAVDAALRLRSTTPTARSSLEPAAATR